MSTDLGRIVFPGNPWPAGHRVAGFVWSGRVGLDGLFFDFHLVTEPYDAADPPDDPSDEIEEEDDEEFHEDWESKIVWGNYHRCTLSSTYWDSQPGIRVGSESEKFSFDRLRELRADPLPVDWKTFEDERAIGIYLLGHDTVADHHLRFEPGAVPGEYSILWTGRIALTYAGSTTFDHAFEARIPAARFEGFVAEEGASPSQARAMIDDLVTEPERYRVVQRSGRVWVIAS